MDNVTYLKMSRLARLLLYISDADNAFRSNRLCLKRLEGVNLTIWIYSLWIFQIWSFWRKSKTLLYVTYEDMKIFSFNLSYFCHFGGVIDISLLEKKKSKILTLPYNRWYQKLFSFNLLETGCLIITSISVLDYYFFLKMVKQEKGSESLEIAVV